MANVSTSTLMQYLCNLLGEDTGAATDRNLLERFAAQHDETAFAGLMKRYGPMVWTVCRRVLGDDHDAEDAFQATFLILSRKAGSIRRRASVGSWLHGVAVHVAQSAKTAAARRRLREGRAPGKTPEQPLADVTVREAQAILDEELARLPDKHRAPIIYCCLEGATRDEAARRLGVPPSLLKSRLEEGRKRLRQRLIRRGLTLPAALGAALLAEGVTPAALPAGLGQATIKFAVAAAAGQSAAIPVNILALADAACKSLGVIKLKAAVLLLLAGLVGAGAGLATFHRGDPQPNAQANPPAGKQKSDQIEAKQVRLDPRGDPLPEAAVLRFGSARLRHGGVIWNSALSPDGKLLATAGRHSVIVWNLETGKPLHRFKCDHGNTFVCPGLAFSPSGTRLGYVRNNYFACVWDLQIGKELRRFERRREDGLGKFWEAYCRFSDQEKEFLLVSREAIESWYVDSGKAVTSIPVKAAILSPNGKNYLRIEGNTGLTLGDARTGNAVTRLEVAAKKDGDENGLAFSPDGKLLAIVHEQKEIQLRRLPDTKLLASFPLPESAEMKHVEGREKYWEYRIGFSTDGKTVLLGTWAGLIHRWDVATAKELPPVKKHSCVVSGMHTLPDGHTLVSTGQDGTIRCWDLQTGRELVQPDSYEGKSAAAYSPDGRFAAIADARGRVDLWDGRTGKLVRTVQQEGTAVTHLAFTPDGKLLAAAERSGTVRFWQLPSGRPGAVWQREPTQGEWNCNGLHFSPDGRLLCVSDYPRQIRVVEVTSGKLLWTGASAYAETFSPDGATLVVAAPAGPYLTMLDPATGKKRATVRQSSKIPDGLGELSVLAFSPDGRRLAFAQGGNLMLCDGHTSAQVQVLAELDPSDELRFGQAGRKIPNRIHALAFSPDSKWFASAGTDAAVYLWEAATGKEVLRLPGHEAEVSTLAFGPDGKSVFSYGQDGQGYLWSLKPTPAAGPRPSLKELWTDLSGTDPGKAYRAVWALSEAPGAAHFLRKQVSPVAPPDKARIAKLIADLDANTFEVRDAATRGLTELAELAVPAIEETCKSTSSLEQRKRLERLLGAAKGRPPLMQIAKLRAVQALELAGGAEAQNVLKDWAQGAPAAHLTQDAQAALARLDKYKE